MSCRAVVSPASPTTYADPPGRWSSRNCAVASAEVQIADSGTSMPPARSRARRSLGVKIELFVSTRKRRPDRTKAPMNSLAPGMARSSWTRTPSMSVSQHSTGLGVVVSPILSQTDHHFGGAGAPPAGGRWMCTKEVPVMSLATSAVTTLLPVTDTGRAKEFYSDRLGLPYEGTNAEGSLMYRLGGGTMLWLLPRETGSQN